MMKVNLTAGWEQCDGMLMQPVACIIYYRENQALCASFYNKTDKVANEVTLSTQFLAKNLANK